MILVSLLLCNEAFFACWHGCTPHTQIVVYSKIFYFCNCPQIPQKYSWLLIIRLILIQCRVTLLPQVLGGGVCLVFIYLYIMTLKVFVKTWLVSQITHIVNLYHHTISYSCFNVFWDNNFNITYYKVLDFSILILSFRQWDYIFILFCEHLVIK